MIPFRPLGVALLLVLARAFLPPALPAQEREEILAFFSVVEIHAGGRMVVTEHIRVRSLGQEIKRGIYRDFPTSFPRERGLGRIRAPFTVLAVERDGHEEPWATESIGGPGGRGGVRVRMGDSNVLLEDGLHDYTLQYETWRWVRFGDQADQLYWNVTGNGWGFPIRSAAARIRLPGFVDSDDVSVEAWTGSEGSTETDASREWHPGANVAAFRTTRPLAPGEGLTVRVTFPKDVVVPPSPEVERLWFRMDWGGFIDAATVVGLILALYIFLWSRLGRDPQEGPLVVRYAPPEGFSPPALGYLRNRGYDDALLAATLVGLGVKGALRLERDGRHWVLHRVDDAAPALAAEERTVFEALLGRRARLKLTASHAATIRKAIKDLKSTLRRQMERTYFVLNRRWFAGGLFLSIAGFAALAWRDRYGIAPEAWFFCLWLTFWSLGVTTLLVRVVRAWRVGLGGGGAGAWAEALFLTLFSTPFVAAELFVLGLLATRIPQHLLLAAVVLGVVNVLFYHLLERPTLEGRGVLDALEGFRAFLTATDADRLDRTLVPERTPRLFERYLPHAIALGVENRWAAAFEGHLRPGDPSSGTATPGLSWYQVSAGSGRMELGALASSLGGGLSSSLSAASSPPSGGGSGGGGGSSGGGGGGGGGGGW